MKKTMEAGLIVVIGVMSTLTTATIIHDQNAGVADPLGRKIWQTFDNAAHWVMKRFEPAAATEAVTGISLAPSGASDGQSATSLTSAVKPRTTAELGFSGWNTPDISHAARIMQTFMHTMTPDDWVGTLRNINDSNAAAADQSIVQLLQSRLSSADLSWLATKFSGQTAFGVQDVQLLQKSFTELEQELTPAEQQLFSQELNQLTAQTANSSS